MHGGIGHTVKPCFFPLSCSNLKYVFFSSSVLHQAVKNAGILLKRNKKPIPNYLALSVCQYNTFVYISLTVEIKPRMPGYKGITSVFRTEKFQQRYLRGCMLLVWSSY